MAEPCSKLNWKEKINRYKSIVAFNCNNFSFALFKTYFFSIKKQFVVRLQEGIDKNKITDPLIPLKKKLSGNISQFSLKPVTVGTVKNIMKSMKLKKSAGPDEISQE